MIRKSFKQPVWNHCIGIIFVLMMCSPLMLSAQIRPDFFPEEIQESEIGVRCYCKPGVRYKSRSKGIKFIYTSQGSGTLKDEDGEFNAPLTKYKNLESFEFDIKAPLVLKDNFNLIIGYKLYKESFSFDQVGADYSNIISQLRGQSLRSSTLSLFGTKPID